MVNASAVKLAATQGIGRTLLVLKKHSPEILTTVGIVGSLSSTVMASRATLKLEKIIDEVKYDLDAARDAYLGHLSDDTLNRDIRKTYIRAALDIAKLYGPSVTLAVSSAGCIIAAHGIMRRRNVALIAAYNVLEKSFTEYRKRVIEEFGEDKDRDFRFGVFDQEVINETTGKKEVITNIDPNSLSTYARFFDEYSANWSKNPEYNHIFLKAQQNYANDLLRARGHLFLNEVYDMLGIERSQAGQVVGWTLSKDGDNFVDFGMYDLTHDQRRHFVNGNEASILLDFNVDGVVFDKI